MGSFSVNLVVLGGYLATDPESKDLPSGESVTRFRLAVGEEDNAVFLSVAAFGKQADVCAEYLGKGSGVVVEGKLHQSQWNTPQGEKKSSLELRATRVAFLPKGSPSKETANHSGLGSGSRPPQ